MGCGCQQVLRNEASCKKEALAPPPPPRHHTTDVFYYLVARSRGRTP